MNRVSPEKILRDMKLLNRPMPAHLNIDLCGVCNQACIWCFFKGGHDPNTGVPRIEDLRKHILPYEIATSVIQTHFNFGGNAITFVGGGEPLMHPDAASIIGPSTKQQKGVITNLAVKLSKEHISAIDSCDWVRVSLDASNRESYKELHGKDHFDRVIGNMKKVHPRALGISFLVHLKNFLELRYIGEIANDVDATYVQIKPVYSEGKCPVPYANIFGQLDHLKRTFKGEVVDDYQWRENVLQYRKRDMPKKQCLVPKYRVHITADGNVYPCCIYKYSPEYSYGSLHDDDLNVILHSMQRTKVDRKLWIDKCPPCWDRPTQIDLHELLDVEDPDFV